MRILKNYNSRKLILDYANRLSKEAKKILYFDNCEYKFKRNGELKQ